MNPPPPILEYQSPQPSGRARFAWQSGVALAVLPVIPAFACGCGYFNGWALLATVPAASFAWWGFGRRLAPYGWIAAGAIAAITSALLIKNLLDVIWFGHNPIS